MSEAHSRARASRPCSGGSSPEYDACRWFFFAYACIGAAIVAVVATVLLLSNW